MPRRLRYLQGSPFSRDGLQADITTLDLKADRGRFALVAGGPPCQPFSVGGKRLAADDARNGIPQFLRALADLRPHAFLMENVPGLAVSTKRPYFLAVLGRLERLGYLTTWRVLEAADYGVPQTRRRLFVVGTRGPRRFSFPGPTHGPSAQRPHPRAGLVVDPQHPRGQRRTRPSSLTPGGLRYARAPTTAISTTGAAGPSSCAGRHRRCWPAWAGTRRPGWTPSVWSPSTMPTS